MRRLKRTFASACLVITKKCFINSPDGIIRRKIEQQWRISTFRLTYTSNISLKDCVKGDKKTLIEQLI